MAAFCIIPEIADKLKSAVEKNAEVFRAASSEERRKFFAEFADAKTAEQINASFEKALVSKQKGAIKSWLERNVTTDEKKSGKFDALSEELDKLDTIINPDQANGFLEDLAAEKLGVRVSADQAKVIVEKSSRIKSAVEAMKKELGNPLDNLDAQLEYAKARNEMDNYIKSLSPQPRLKIATAVIGRGMMLARFGSAFVNVASNTLQGFKQAVDRRIVEKRFGGLNGDLVGKYVDNNVKIYNSSGIDLSRMLDINEEPIVKGEHLTHSEGPGKTRAVGRAIEKGIFQFTQGSPDVAFASWAFGDRANITSTKMALEEGLKGKEAKERAKEIMVDAMRVEPQTKEGKLVREESIADAAYSTGTQDSATAKAALKVRDALNEFTGDLRAGDLTTPFVKTPANFIEISLENSGVLTLPQGALRIWNTISRAKEMGLKNAAAESFKGYGTQIVRAGTGMVFAAALAEYISPKDFIGAYPTNQTEQDLLKAKKASPNSILLGDKWVSLDYFGPLKGAMIGYFYQKKYGGTLSQRAWNYINGVKLEVASIPGFSDAVGEIKRLQEAPGLKNQVDQGLHDAGMWAVNFIQARTIPGFISDFAKARDTYDRTATPGDIFSNVKKNLPFLRESLPIAKNVFGEDIASQGWTTFLLGSRYKTGEGNAIFDELTRLSTVGQLPSINNVEEHTKSVQELKTQIPDTEFRKALEFYGRNLKADLLDLMQSDDYIEGTDEEKKNLMNNLKKDDLNEMLDEYGYVKPEKDDQ